MNKSLLQLALVALFAVACVPIVLGAEQQGGMNSNAPRVDPKLGSKEPAYTNMNSNAPAAKPALNSEDLKMKPAAKVQSKEPAAAPGAAGKPARTGIDGADLKVKPATEKLGSKEPAG
jgi:hypothetical protein